MSAAANARSGGNWLSVFPGQSLATANLPSNLTIRADPAGLGPGTYLGQISVQGSTGQTAVVQATLIVSPVKQKLLLTASGFTFQAVAGGGIVPPQSFAVGNDGDGVLDWTAAAGPAWLSLSRPSGSSPAGSTPVEVVTRANAGSLAPGVYYDRVTVTAPQADNAPQIISTVLSVLPPDSSPGPVLQPSGLLFTAVAGGISPGSQTVNVYNPGTSPISFNSNRLTLDGSNWFVHLPAAGVITPQEPVPLVVQPNLTGLAPGIYSGVITLLFSNQAIRTVNLLFVVAPALQPAVVTGAAPGITARAACAPGKLALLFTSLSGAFTGQTGWPTPIVTKVVDDCGTPLTNGFVVVTFNNGDPPLALNPSGAGTFSGTWTPRRGQSTNVVVTARAQSNSGLKGEAQLQGQTLDNRAVPLLRPNAIVNAAYPAAPVPVAPGTLLALFGSGLAASPQVAAGLPLPYSLAGTSVLMAGRQLPLLYAADGQVNTLIPYDMGFNTRQQLTVAAGDKLTTPELVSIAAAQPVMFTLDGSGSGQGLVYAVANGTRTTLADSVNPAAVGDEILPHRRWH